MAKLWLRVMGLELSSLQGLDKDRLDKIKQAKVIFADGRFHDPLCAMQIKAKLHPWPRPFTKIYDLLQALKKQGEETLLLATGDPLHFGVASRLSQYFTPEEMEIIPARSGFNLAAAKLGWPLNHAHCLSLHGRPVNRLKPYLLPHQSLLLLANHGKSPHELCHLLCELGFTNAMITCLAHIGGENEQIFPAQSVEEFLHNAPDIPDFHMIGVKMPPCASGQMRYHLPGLADEYFEHDGKMTKQAVRALALQALQPFPEAVFWDLGCGAGSVALEYGLMADRAKIWGIDKHVSRLAMAEHNAKNLGMESQITWLMGDNMEMIADLPMPDAIFIGGGMTAELLSICFQRLRQGGRLVANAVTINGQAWLMDFAEQYDGQLQQIQLSHSDKLSKNYRAMRPQMAVLQLILSKQGE